MEATTATTPIEASTGSKTIADLLALAAAEPRPTRSPCATSATASGTTSPTPRSARSSREIGLGLIDLGIAARRARLASSPHPPRVDLRRLRDHRRRRRRRPRSTRPTPRRSASGCVGNSEACAVVCEDADQVAKIVAVRDRLPDLRTTIIVDRPGAATSADAIPLDDAARARRAPATAGELEAPHATPSSPEDPFTFIYTSGTTGPPKGCVLTHGNYRSMLDMSRGLERRQRRTRSSTCSCRSPTPSRC